MQAGLLYETVTGQAGAYVQQVVITCDEQLDEEAQRQAWMTLLDRHDALRTSFVIDELTAPRQRVQDRIELGFVTLDWRPLTAMERERRWQELLRADRQTGFDLARAPLMRVAICRLHDGVTRILWTYHHAILDGRSRLTLLREVFRSYTDVMSGRATPWTAPPAFSRFAAWAAQSGSDPATEAFWRGALSGGVEPTPAPGAVTSAAPGSETRSIACRLDSLLSKELRGFADAYGVGLGTVLQAAYALLLSQEADRDDLLYLTTRAGRRSVPFDASEMVGLLMVTSPVRLRLDPTVSVGEWLSQVHRFGRAVRDHEHASLADLYAWSGIQRPQPIAETLFSYENASMNTLLRASDDSWTGRDVQLIEQLGFALTLEAFGDDEILVRAPHDPARVSEQEANRVVDRYRDLLRACVEHRQDPVGGACALPPARRAQLSGERAAAPQSELVPSRIRAHVSDNPDRIAIEDGDRRLTYGQLDARAAELAAHLAALGVQASVPVAVATARTPDMVCTLLAAHRLGAPYVPLDLRHPAERVGFMLDDSHAQVVVSDDPAHPALRGRAVLAIDDLPASPIRSPDVHRISPDDLSHIIYTSGSTGRPKGVLIEHRSVAHLTGWAERTFTAAERDGMLASTSLSFDLSVFELLVTLALGGRIVLVDDVLSLAEPDFSGDVSFVNSVPSALGAVLRASDLPAGVRTVALAGEALPQALVDRLYSHPTVKTVWNLYGPSEDTTYSTAYRCRRDERPLIGRPLPGTQAYVIDRHLRALPEGVWGELVLGGAGLARGYLDRPDLTAARFVDIEFESDTRARVYRTGDRARWTEGGELEYGGRLDDQVKIRGVRVEPGEIAHTLRSLDRVADAAVIARGEGADLALVAYVVGDRLEPEALADALRSRLPPALLPQAIVMIDRLPLMANGKLDRRALPEPGARSAGAAGATLTGATQRELAALWVEVLEITSTPGADDDFFALGGDSLDTLQLLTAIKERFGRRLSVRALLAATRLSDQAEAIDEAREEPPSAAVIPLRATGDKPPFICILTDQRGVVGLRNVLPAILGDQPVFAMEAVNPARPSWRRSTIEEIAGACLQAMRRSRPHGPHRLGGHSLGGLVAFEMACQLVAAGEEVELVVLIDTLAPELFRWWGRRAGRLRLLDDAPPYRRLRDQASLLYNSLREAYAVARDDGTVRVSSRDRKGASVPTIRGFDDPFDIAGTIRISRSFHPPRLAAPVTVLSTRESAIRAGAADLGWSRHVEGRVRTRSLPGDHETILAQAHAQALASQLAEELAALETTGAS